MSVIKSWDRSYAELRVQSPLRWPDSDVIRLVSRADNLNSLQFLKILDYGCGEGRNSRFLIDKFPDADIFCADTSHSALSILKSLYGDSVQTLNIGPGYEKWLRDCDLVVCWGVMHYVGDALALVKKLCSLLKSGGSIIISFQGERDNRPRMAEIERLFTKYEAEKIMRDSGFKVNESGENFNQCFSDGTTSHLYWFRATAE